MCVVELVKIGTCVVEWKVNNRPRGKGRRVHVVSPADQPMPKPDNMSCFE
jgi:hypothetical protein